MKVGRPLVRGYWSVVGEADGSGEGVVVTVGEAIGDGDGVLVKVGEAIGLGEGVSVGKDSW